MTSIAEFLEQTKQMTADRQTELPPHDARFDVSTTAFYHVGNDTENLESLVNILTTRKTA